MEVTHICVTSHIPPLLAKVELRSGCSGAVVQHLLGIKLGNHGQCLAGEPWPLKLPKCEWVLDQSVLSI